MDSSTSTIINGQVLAAFINVNEGDIEKIIDLLRLNVALNSKKKSILQTKVITIKDKVCIIYNKKRDNTSEEEALLNQLFTTPLCTVRYTKQQFW